MHHPVSLRRVSLALSLACLTSPVALAQAPSDAAATEPEAVVEAPGAAAPAAAEPAATDADVGDGAAPSDAAGGEPEAAEGAETTPEEAETEEAETEKAAPANKLLVLDLVDRGAGEPMTKRLSEAIGAQAGRSASDVVTAAGLRASLDAAELALLSGCDAEGCMTSLAGEVSADRVLGGSVALAGADLLITVVLVDVANGARLGDAQRKVRAEPTLAAYAARGLVAQVLGSGPLGEAVPVLLESDPAGARAYLDGNAVGSTPVVVSVMPGSHEVTLRADGFDEQILGLIVEDGAPVVVSATLSQPLVRLWPIAAALGGVAVLAAGGASWAGISAANAYDGSYGMFTPDEDIARSYRYATPIDSVGLAEKQQHVEQLALLSNVLWTATVISVVGAILVESADVALWALRE